MKIRVINIYAPNHETDRKNMFRSLQNWCTSNCVIVGDFNVALTECDVSRNNKFKSDTSRTVLLDLITSQGLADIWRLMHPKTRDYSRRQVVMGSLKQTRIDLCLVSQNMIRLITNVKYNINVWSDHADLSFKITANRTPWGCGLWCLNASLCEDSLFLKAMSSFLKSAETEISATTNISEWWESLKQRIKRKCINFSKHKAWLERQTEAKLKKSLMVELENPGEGKVWGTDRYISLKLQLEKINKRKCAGAAVRSRIRHLYDGERCTSFFLGSEKGLH